MQNLPIGCYCLTVNSAFVSEVTSGKRSLSGKGMIGKIQTSVFDLLLSIGNGNELLTIRIQDSQAQHIFSYMGTSLNT